MSCTFNKPKGLKYTDMAIYIDAHLPEIEVNGENPEVESKIFEYIYHILYALAYKAGYFKKYDDYDEFALYGASELFISMRKKIQNKGNFVRGKEVKPVKSSLNYIKSVLFPLKVNYQRQFFNTVMNPEIDSGISDLGDKIKDDIQSEYNVSKLESYTYALEDIPSIIHKIIDKTPFRKDKYICDKLYISVLLSLLDEFTLPNKIKNKLNKKEEKYIKKIIEAYRANSKNCFVWHLDENWANFIRILSVKAKKEFSKTVNYYLHMDDLSDELLEGIINSAYLAYNDLLDEEV